MADENEPKQPEEKVDFDHGTGDHDESMADFDAEEQNPKEATA